MPTQNSSETAWLHVTAAVFVLVAAVLFFSAIMIQRTHIHEPSSVALQRAMFLTQHDCDQHLRLAHTVALNDAEWRLVEVERNAQHQQLCEDLKRRVRNMAMGSGATRQVIPSKRG